MKHGKHDLGNDAREIGTCILNKITFLKSLKDGSKLINECSKNNSELKIFFLNILNDD